MQQGTEDAKKNTEIKLNNKSVIKISIKGTDKQRSKKGNTHCYSKDIIHRTL